MQKAAYWLYPLLGALLAACTTTPRATLPITDLLELREDPLAYQVLYPGDEIEVRFEAAPELSVTLPVRPDGTIKLPLSRTLRAAGRTPEELELEVEAQYGKELRNPQATVLVQGFDGRRVHVGGEVERPGPQVLSGPVTLLEAVIAAGGPRESAYLAQVLLVRGAGLGERRVYELNLRDVIDGHALPSDIVLQPTDVVYLPRSPIAEVNVWVDQYIRRNLPFAVAVRPGVGNF